LISHSKGKRKLKSSEAKRRKGQRGEKKVTYMFNHNLSDSVQVVCFKQLQQPEHTEAWLFAQDTWEVQEE
jgi:hypothetical protein